MAELHEAIALQIYYYNTKRIHSKLYDNSPELIAHLVRCEPAVEERVQLLQSRFDEQKRLAANGDLKPEQQR